MAASSSASSSKPDKGKLYSLQLYRVQDSAPKATELISILDVSSFSFFQRSTMGDFLKFGGKTIAERAKPTSARQSVQLEGNVAMAHSLLQGDICGLVISDSVYPQRVAFQLISEVIRKFKEQMKGKYESSSANAASIKPQFPFADEQFKKFQDPGEADKLTKIQNDLLDVQETVTKTLDQILERGEKLDSLVDKSDALGASSKMFYRTAKKNNQCCQMY